MGFEDSASTAGPGAPLLSWETDAEAASERAPLAVQLVPARLALSVLA